MARFLFLVSTTSLQDDASPIDRRYGPTEVCRQRLVAIVPVLQKVRVIILRPPRAGIRCPGDRPLLGISMPLMESVDALRRDRAFRVDGALDRAQGNWSTLPVIGMAWRLPAKGDGLPAVAAGRVLNAAALRRPLQEPTPVMDRAFLDAERTSQLRVGHARRIENRPDLVIGETGAHAGIVPGQIGVDAKTGIMHASGHPDRSIIRRCVDPCVHRIAPVTP
jgi:hypothetical protein